MFVTNKERLKRNWLKETPTISYTFICSINTKLNAPKLLVLLMWKLGLKEMLRRWWYTKSRSRTEMVNYRKMSSGLIYEQFKTKDLINSVKVLCCQWWTFSVCGIVLNQINWNKKTATICIGKNRHSYFLRYMKNYIKDSTDTNEEHSSLKLSVY